MTGSTASVIARAIILLVLAADAAAQIPITPGQAPRPPLGAAPQEWQAYQQCMNTAAGRQHRSALQVRDLIDNRALYTARWKKDPRAQDEFPGGIDDAIARAFEIYKASGGTAQTPQAVVIGPSPCPTPFSADSARSGSSPGAAAREPATPPSGQAPARPAAAGTGVGPDFTTQDPAKQMEIAEMYRRGMAPAGVDLVEAAHWFRKSAEQDYVPAMKTLGDLYLAGAGVARDDREAAKWYRRAADKGNTDAMVAFGLLQATDLRGTGTINEFEAARWYRKAAEQGNVLAMVYLARALQTGRGVPVDKEEALKWYRSAAEHGNAVSASWVQIADKCRESGKPIAACL